MLGIIAIALADSYFVAGSWLEELRSRMRCLLKEEATPFDFCFSFLLHQKLDFAAEDFPMPFVVTAIEAAVSAVEELHQSSSTVASEVVVEELQNHL